MKGAVSLTAPFLHVTILATIDLDGSLNLISFNTAGAYVNPPGGTIMYYFDPLNVWIPFSFSPNI